MQLLSELVAKAGLQATVLGNASVPIADLTVDSREVRPQSLFVAMPGIAADGAKYIPEALRAGASAILMSAQSRSDVVATVPLVKVADMRAAVSHLAAAFYGAQPEFCVGVTGTDGKTSTADFVRQLAQQSGMDAASIGTLGLRSTHAELNKAFPKNNTSPEPILLHRTLAMLHRSNVRVVAMETSSHGLDQKRMDSVNFSSGAFTNFTRDHLDYHGTIEAYYAAKSRLFGEVLKPGATAVLNQDDAHVMRIKTLCAQRRLRVTSFGSTADADYQIVSLRPHAEGMEVVLRLRSQQHTLALPLYGAFQVSNMLTAIGLLAACGLSEQKMVALLPTLKGVPGRLERIATVQGAPVFIDYAHTPAALENILRTLRPHTQKRLHVVFGCGGDRDAGKRPEMGAAAVKFADVVTVTDDNPRNENAATIRAAILANAPGAIEVASRAQAIATAIKNLLPGDVLVVAGKGHETSQIIGSQTLPFNDADEIRKAVAA